MNTLKKIGLTALGTSLVAGSAYAGEITASGDAGYTYSSEEVGVRTDEGYGFNHDITFSGSGELDNGFTSFYNYDLNRRRNTFIFKRCFDYGWYGYNYYR